MLLDRRRLLTAAAGAVALATLPAAAAAHAETLTVPVGDRQMAVSIWRPSADPVGVVLFGHGMGGQPQNYNRLLTLWHDAGWLVLAPLHVDSQAHPQRAQFSMQQSFAARIADMTALGAVAARMAPGKPLAAAGHSYGSLFAQMLGGALSSLAPMRNPAVKAVVAYSSPGRIPGLVGPDAFAGLAAPTLMVTADRDVVPGFVTDPRDHLAAFDGAPAGGRLALIYAGAEHFMINAGQPPAAFEDAARNGLDFLRAHALDDAAARARLDALISNTLREVRRR